MFSSLRARFTLSHLVVIVIAMGAAAAMLLTFLRAYFIQSTEDSLAAQARLTAQALIPGASVSGPQIVDQSPFNTQLQQQSIENLNLQAQNIDVPQDPIEPGKVDLTYLSDADLQLGAQLTTRIRVLDVQGTVLVDSNGGSRGTSLRDDELIVQALSGEYASLVLEEGESTIVQVAVPMMLDDQIVGVVHLSQPLDDVIAVLGDVRDRLWLATALATLLAALTALLLSRAISRPIGALTKAAGKVAAGDLETSVPAKGRHEIARLSRAFNEMTTRLKSARQAQVDFVANVSHELRTPMTSIKGMLETLGEGDVEPEARDRFLHTMRGEADRLINLVNDLIVLSQADSAKLELKREMHDLADVVSELARSIEHVMTEKGLTLRIETLVEGVRVSIDRARIEQVLFNLLDNAVKYSPLGGKVTIRLEKNAGNDARVIVQDEGPGISAEDMARIGERFFRVDKARSRQEGGGGLGLAIAKALVEAHGGELTIESREGEGTAVSFTLP